MAKAENGIDGPIAGKVGNHVFSTWRGIPIVKRKGVRTAPLSEKQMLNTWMFKKKQEWLSPITEFLKIGFKGYTLTNQGVTAAMSYLSNHAFIKEGYNSYIDPALMKVSYGNLQLPENIQLSLDPEKQLNFTWEPNFSRENSRLDQVLLLAYNVEEKDAAMALGGKFRQDGSASLPLAHHKPGQYQVYLAFVAEDRLRQSDSVYLGTVDLAE